MFLLGVPRLGRKGHYARLLRIAVYVYMDVLFLLYRRVDLYLLEIGVWGRFDVEIAQNAVPVGLCAVGPGMRALDFGWYGAGGIVNAYLYMVVAGCWLPAGYSSEVHRYVPTCRRCPRLSREYWALYVP